jgi:hypothetical protein
MSERNGILTSVLDGILVHKDDLGHAQVIRMENFSTSAPAPGMRPKRFAVPTGRHYFSARSAQRRLTAPVRACRFSAGNAGSST